MATIEQSIEVEVPVRTAYNQWTQFEEFPQFMEGVEEVRQLDDSHLHWVAEFGGTPHEWDAEITEQIPDERVAWRSTGGKDNAGVVTFHRLDDDRTRVMVQMDYEPEGIKEKVGDALGFADRRVKGDLERFKELIEARGRRDRRLARRGPARGLSRGRIQEGRPSRVGQPRRHRRGHRRAEDHRAHGGGRPDRRSLGGRAAVPRRSEKSRRDRRPQAGRAATAGWATCGRRRSRRARSGALARRPRAPGASTSRVSRGSITPSSHSRAVE